MDFSLSLTLIIVIITSIVSIGAFNNHKTMDDLIFYGPAISERRQWYRMITHGLIHADTIHLIFNMVALYSFGTALEKVFSASCLFGNMGRVIFFILYITALIAASIPDYIKHKDNYHFRSLGASGAVSAVVFASIVVLPTAKVSLFILPIGIPGYIFAIIYLGISAYLDKRGSDNINHGAHMWGALYGLLFTIALIYAMAELDVIENFKEQLKADQPFIPDYCR